MVLIPRRFSDSRGYFSETWNARAMRGAGLDLEFVQDNHSYSRSRGTVRGLHYQAPPHAQDKLVRVAAGRIIDVAVDARRGSPTFGKWVACELSAENGRQLLVPRGFLHGFATLEDDTVVLYKTTDFYAPESEGSVRFDDPDLAIDWGLDGVDPLLSEKDARAPSFAEFDSPFRFGGDD
ncbi:MAG: dTDP-4-dehydrorhamnose 3,5-epimerase [Paracoccaceae bacterium]